MNQFLARRSRHRLDWIRLLVERFSRLFHRCYDDGCRLVFYILERRKKEKKKKEEKERGRKGGTYRCVLDSVLVFHVMSLK